MACKICGKPLQHGHTYCSRECMGESYTKQVTLNCEICGQEFHVAIGRIKTARFCSKSCRSKYVYEKIKSRFNAKGLKPHNYKGGHYDKGYYWICLGEGKYQKRARFKMEKHLGRKLKTSEIVHHKNEIKTDDSIRNLEIMTRSQHAYFHMNKEA